MKISIIIVDYHKSDRVVRNVKSLLAQKGNFDPEIIIIDNSESPENAKELRSLAKNPKVHLIINAKNIGYSRANNLGVQSASGDFFIILNPDIYWHQEDTLQKLIDFFEKNQDVGILAPRQIHEKTGVREITVRNFPTLWIQIVRRTFLRKFPGIRSAVAKDEMRHLDYKKTQSVPWVQSSFLMIRKNFWNKLGGLDERYFIFMADTELCWQAWKAGQPVVYFPEAEVMADGLRCSGNESSLALQKQHFSDALKFSRKHLFEPWPKIQSFIRK